MSIDLIAAAVSVLSLVAALVWAYCDDCRVVRRHRSRLQPAPDAKPSQVTKVA